MNSRRLVRGNALPPAVAQALIAFAFTCTPLAAQRFIELPLEDRLLTADIPEVYRVGDGIREWELLSRVTSLSFDAQGNLHIGDLAGDELSVLVVGPQGQLRVRFGRKGEGPGEFRGARHAFALPDGRTVVADDMHMAYQVFDGEGNFERWIRYPGVTASDDRPPMYVRSTDPRVRKMDHWEGNFVARVTFARDFQVVDSVNRRFNLQTGPGPRTVKRILLDGEEAHEVDLAGASDPQAEGEFHFGPLPGGRVAYTDTTAYTIMVVGPEQGSDRVLVRPLPARVWDEGTERGYKEFGKRAVREAVDAGGDQAELVGMFGGEQSLIQRIDATEHTGAIPHVAALETTWEGRIWVLRTPAAGFVETDFIGTMATAFFSAPTGLTAAGPGPIDVITPEGEYVGTLPESRMPNAFGPDGLVAYVEVDEFDVPTVVVRRIPEAIR